MAVIEPVQKMIVGLGNPGPRYAATRHNIGYAVVEALARRENLVFAEQTPVYLGARGQRCALVKPLTFMNLSGEALPAWSVAHRQRLSGTADEGLRPLVVCDDLALPLGSVRFRASGSSGGQNGLASVIEHLGGEEFPRLRLGIAPLAAPVQPEAWPGFVLADFTTAELAVVADVIEHAVSALSYWLGHDLETTASRFNRRVRRTESGEPSEEA